MNKEDYSKYYIQGSDHYLIPKDVFNELFNEMLNWKEESIELNKKYLNAVSDYETTMSELQELKKQLEENKDKINWYENFEINKTIDKLRIKHNNQQKEFIEYLEDLIKQNETVVEVSKYGLPKNCSKLLIDFYKEILQKYKSIIGCDKVE